MWNEAAEDDLIKLWQAKMPQLRSVRQYRQTFVYEEMAKAMESLGHEYTAAEIKVKLYEFTNKYKQEQQKNGPSSWKHFTAVHEALGGFCFDELVEDSIMVDIENIEPIYEDCETSSSDSSNHSSSSDTENDNNKTELSVMEEIREIFLKTIQTWKETNEREQILLQEHANDVREMQKAFIDFLRRQN